MIEIGQPEMRRGRKPAAALALALAIAVPSLVACSLLADFDDLASKPANGPDSGDVDGDGAPTSDGSSKEAGAFDGAAPILDGGEDARVLGCDAPDLVAFYRFDEGSGGEVGDCSPNKLLGLIELDGGSGWGSGVRGSAVNLNASFVAIGDFAPLRLTGAMTIAAFVRIVDLPATERPAIASKMGQGSQRGWELSVNTFNDGRGARFTVSPDNIEEISVATPALPSDEWVHVAGTVTPGGELRIYVQGALAGTAASPAQLANASVPMRIGGRSYAYYWRGLIDEVRIFQRELNAIEIAQLAKR